MTPVSKMCAKVRVEKFPDDTIRDNIKLKPQTKTSSQLKQKTIISLLKCKEVRDDFVLDFFLNMHFVWQSSIKNWQNEAISIKIL